MRGLVNAWSTDRVMEEDHTCLRILYRIVNFTLALCLALVGTFVPSYRLDSLGVIAIEGGEPTITCKFHNSKFALTDGKCKAWSESVFGIKGTEGIAGFVGGFGGAKGSPATVFPTSTSEEGIVSIEM